MPCVIAVCRVNTVRFNLQAARPDCRVLGSYRVGIDDTDSLVTITVIDSANGSPRADLGHRVASQTGRACVAARLAMTVQPGERGRSGLR